jgi:16S rRNA (adenine1518-N6/adenine1519-N6)-dimethyltransferase
VGRKLGQHFLRSRAVAKFMVDAARLTGSETVLEIGPGRGIITRLLARRAARVVAVEKDRSLERYLRDLPANVELVWGDALEMEWPGCDVLVSNVPFYISSELLFSMPAVPAVLGLQKEFARRMAAEPGSRNYGRLSVSAQLKFHVELLREFPATVFSPPPEVELAVVRLEPNRPDLWEEAEEFIRRVFPYLNKKVDNALEHGGYPRLGVEKRVRELTPAEVVELARRVRR